RETLRKPDRAPVARREHERVEQALLALRDERASETEQRGEEDRDPEEAELREPGRAGREREVEDREDRKHEQQHRRERVAGPELEPQVLARQGRGVSQIATQGRVSRSRAARAAPGRAWRRASSGARASRRARGRAAPRRPRSGLSRARPGTGVAACAGTRRRA